MFGLFVAIVGILIIGITLYFTLKEFRREAKVELQPDASFYETIQNMDDEILRLRSEFDGINESYYLIVEELNDKIKNLQRKLEAHEALEIKETKKFESEIEIDVSREVKKNNSYHTYEMPTEKTEFTKEVHPFPDQAIRREIVRLFHSGLTAPEIAKEVNKGIGEIDLILNLLGKK